MLLCQRWYGAWIGLLAVFALGTLFWIAVTVGVYFDQPGGLGYNLPTLVSVLGILSHIAAGVYTVRRGDAMLYDEPHSQCQFASAVGGAVLVINAVMFLYVWNGMS